ncbi:hypothetical protein RHMOL_Rhmol12G0097900 [Rhododendron molle]|uniref:Uncharacterized protein n=1 Tax=Rhododendron molle TaxID=49168 RepID=A0ACC0LG70_RHOML|nr:hypothetical protein RHMOL_Rhmol12G0097900 [Rhododendron molle]
MGVAEEVGREGEGGLEGGEDDEREGRRNGEGEEVAGVGVDDALGFGEDAAEIGGAADGCHGKAGLIDF